MELTREEEEMRDGEHGPAIQKAMDLLIAVGECFDAERLVKIHSAHLVSANPITAGKGGTAFIKEMGEKGGKCVVPTTTNPACLEPWLWREMGFQAEIYQEHEALSEILCGIGGFLSNTCVPYLIGHLPRMREHLAWGESSAVLYANAVIGARTNREGGPTALASAITGRTPAYGYHLDNNRYGKLKIAVNLRLEEDTDYATLGYFTGKIAQDQVPIFTGINSSISNNELKCLGAALATSGSVAHYHVVGITGEAPAEEVASGFCKITSSQVFEFGLRELRRTEESLTNIEPEKADLVILGCPHSSITQLGRYAEKFSGKKIKSNVQVWILTCSGLKKYAEDLGFARVFRTAGARLISNTCPVIMPLDFFKKQGFSGVASDSAKMIYYISTSKQLPCYYGSLDKFISVICD